MAASGGRRTFVLAPALCLTALLVACSSGQSDETFVASLTVPATTATTATAAPAATIQPGTARWSSTIVSSPDGSLVYVANPDSGSVTAVAADGERVLWEVAVGRDPTTLALDPPGDRLFVAVAGEDRLVELDAHTGEEAARLTTHRQPRGILVTPDGGMLAVSARAGNVIDLFDTTPLEPQGSVEVGADPWGLAMPAHGDTLD
ncbi:MAG: YncE family protein, partial [Acidimicrobiales bacterium]|nr:YncE family protein [Acidimicrobiales bacterium]